MRIPAFFKKTRMKPPTPADRGWGAAVYSRPNAPKPARVSSSIRARPPRPPKPLPLLPAARLSTGTGAPLFPVLVPRAVKKTPIPPQVPTSPLPVSSRPPSAHTQPHTLPPTKLRPGIPLRLRTPSPLKSPHPGSPFCLHTYPPAKPRPDCALPPPYSRAHRPPLKNPTQATLSAYTHPPQSLVQTVLFRPHTAAHTIPLSKKPIRAAPSAYTHPPAKPRPDCTLPPAHSRAHRLPLKSPHPGCPFCLPTHPPSQKPTPRPPSLPAHPHQNARTGFWAVLPPPPAPLSRFPAHISENRLPFLCLCDTLLIGKDIQILNSN